MTLSRVSRECDVLTEDDISPSAFFIDLFSIIPYTSVLFLLAWHPVDLRIRRTDGHPLPSKQLGRQE